MRPIGTSSFAKNMITKYMIEIQMAGHQKNKFIKLAPMLCTVLNTGVINAGN